MIPLTLILQGDRRIEVLQAELCNLEVTVAETDAKAAEELVFCDDLEEELKLLVEAVARSACTSTSSPSFVFLDALDCLMTSSRSC